MIKIKQKTDGIDTLIRAAVIFGLVGLFCVFLFLLTGFQGWTVGVGVFFGFPVLLIAVVLYIIAVIRDLRRHEVMKD